MSGIAIYMEGATALRPGMEIFLRPLKDEARAKDWHWKLVCCGGRDATFERYQAAIEKKDKRYSKVVLLVDADIEVKGSVKDHIRANYRKSLKSTSEDSIHLMVQIMENGLSPTPMH